MAINFPTNATIGDEYSAGGKNWTWTGAAWESVVASSLPSTDFILSMGNSEYKTFQLSNEYPAGGYTVSLSSQDSTFDIYMINSAGTNVGYSNGSKIVASEKFDKVSVIGTTVSEILSFTYSGINSTPSISSLESGSAPILITVSDNMMIDIDDTVSVSGKNFASDIEVIFVGSDSVERPAKSVSRISSTSITVTRPDSLPSEYSPYTLVASNPGVQSPTGSNPHILVNAINSGTAPSWTTSQTQYYTLGGQPTPQIYLAATDLDSSSINFSVHSGILPDGLSLNGLTGVITGTFSGAAVEGDSSSVTIRATDTGGNYSDRIFTFVANQKPLWTTSSGPLPSATSNSGYSYQLSASYGTVGSSLSYSIESGQLPTGMSLSSSGLISGINNGTTGTFTIVVRATDAIGAYSDRSFSVQVVAPPAKITRISESLYNTYVGDVAVDASGKVYANVSYQDTSAVSYRSFWGQVAFDENRNILSSSINQNNQAYGGPGKMSIDSSGNIYAYGMDGASGYRSLVRKWSPNMESVLWSKQHSSPNGQAYPYDGRLSPNGNYFVASSQSYWSGGVFYPCHWAFDTSGNVLWTKRWTDANDSPVRVSFMNNGSCILKNGTQAYFRRHNTATGAYENQTWRFSVSGNTDQNRITEMAFAPDDSAYYVFSQANSAAYVSRFEVTSPYAPTWTKTFSSGGSTIVFNNSLVDPATGNVFLGGYYSSSGNNIGIIVCLDPSGNVVFTRQLNSPGTTGNNIFISQIVGSQLYVSLGFDNNGAFISMAKDGSTAVGSATAGGTFSFIASGMTVVNDTSVITVEYSTSNAGSTANDVSVSNGDTSYRSVGYTTNTATFA